MWWKNIRVDIVFKGFLVIKLDFLEDWFICFVKILFRKGFKKYF